MKSKWKPGTRVRVRATVKDGTAGLTGIIEAVDYAQTEEATSVLVDGHQLGGVAAGGCYFKDEELEEL
ncbi:hypothetical protein ACFVYF_18700 [Streptomyces sp. NPDC058274]|uniref:hypothetical protein n=1 Tax=Streptomyces sp. NPDC058274 TaxID=3346416 RepID=UPI0036E2314D